MGRGVCHRTVDRPQVLIVPVLQWTTTWREEGREAWLFPTNCWPEVVSLRPACTPASNTARVATTRAIPISNPGFQ